jgi:hypothetical protein
LFLIKFIRGQHKIPLNQHIESKRKPKLRIFLNFYELWALEKFKTKLSKH